MDPTPLNEILAATGRYETAPRPGSRPRSDLWFYAKLAGVILRGSRIARSGGYTPDVWRGQSVEILRMAEAAGGRVSISGMELTARHPGPKVFAANHMSMLETLLMPGLVLSLGGAAFVIKQDLVKYPFFGHIMRATNSVSVTRENPREDFKTVLTEGTRAIESGRSMVIFPQRTRSRVFEAAAFNTLAIKLARRAGVPIVPVALKTDFMGVGRFVRDFGRLDRRQPVRFRFGEPLAVGGRERETHEQVVRFIAATLREWGCAVVDRPEGEG